MGDLFLAGNRILFESIKSENKYKLSLGRKVEIIFLIVEFGIPQLKGGYMYTFFKMNSNLKPRDVPRSYYYVFGFDLEDFNFN